MKREYKKIASLMKKLDDNARTEERAFRILSSLNSRIDEALPLYLYKYRHNDPKNLDALINNRLYLGVPSSFNDPTESMAYVDPETMIDFAMRLPSESTVFGDCDDEEIENGNITKRTEIMNLGLSYIQTNRTRVKICCLSEVIDSPLMWAHYADNHAGFAIRYKARTIYTPECDRCDDSINMYCRRPYNSIFPVIYRDRRYDASRMAFARAIMLEINGKKDDSEYPFPLLTVLQKSGDWNYEKEWRIVCNNKRINYMTAIPDAIFLGELIGAELALKLAHVAREKNIRLYKMQIDYLSPSFCLTCDDWSEYTDETIGELVHDTGPMYG